MSENGAKPTREQALATLRGHDKFLLTTHERPDGDAVGSLAAMQLVLTALGKDSVAFLTSSRCLFNRAVWSRNAWSLGLASALTASLDFSIRAAS